MVYRDSHDANRSLHAVAATQGGYFTAKQAAASGYDYPHLSYHLHALSRSPRRSRISSSAWLCGVVIGRMCHKRWFRMIPRWPFMN
jgi:hypothetical protein